MKNLRRLKARIVSAVRRRLRRLRRRPAAVGPLKFAAALAALALPILCGCATQPNKAQEARIDADSITVLDARGAAALALVQYAASNAVDAATLAALLDALPSGDFALVSQAMANETGGDESVNQAASPSTSVPIDVMRGTGGGSSWADLGSGIGALVNSVTGKSASAPAADCADCAEPAPAAANP